MLLAEKAKRYPFSMIKYGHNIELAYNHLKNIAEEMESGERPWNEETFESLARLERVYANAIGNPIYYATGKEYGLLKDYSMWAEMYRDSRNYK